MAAYAHIVCAVIGSGVLSLAWSMSWLGELCTCRPSQIVFWQSNGSACKRSSGNLTFVPTERCVACMSRLGRWGHRHLPVCLDYTVSHSIQPNDPVLHCSTAGGRFRLALAGHWGSATNLRTQQRQLCPGGQALEAAVQLH